MNPDYLIARLNELATNAAMPELVVVRTQTGPLSADEFSALSESLSILAADTYVNDGNDPDSLVPYAAVEAIVDADVTAMRLVAVERAMSLMRFVRVYPSWTAAKHTSVVVTHATWSEANANTAWGHVGTYWGGNSNPVVGGFAIAATRSVEGGTPASFAQFSRTLAGGLEVRATANNAQLSFDITPYVGHLGARVLVKGGACNPVTAATEKLPPETAYANLHSTPTFYTACAKWRQYHSTTATGAWLGDILPDRNDSGAAPTIKPIGYPSSNGVAYRIGWRANDAAVLIEMPKKVRE